jgi:cation diffusion facilitator CzcD-associated flavoprotein CzcO
MFPHHSQIIRYFDSYVDHFGFRDKIQFNTSVIDVKPEADGSYTVTTDKGNTENYSWVMVANGHHWNPRYPDPPFKGQFNGETMHVHYYKTPDVLENKNVLIIGFGNSAVDVACEAARLHTGNVFLSTRSGAYVVPNYIMGIPFDTLATPSLSKMPIWFQRAILNFSLWLARGPQEAYGVPKPKRKILSEHPTLSQDFLNLAGRGKVKVKPNVQELAGDEVVFEDGSREKIDIIIYATGYKVTFPFLSADHFKPLKVEETNDIQLYRRVLHPDYPGLFFLGLVQPLGAIMPLAEVQAIYAAKLISGEVSLPSKEAMQKDIEDTRQKVAKRYKKSVRHTLQVDFFPYKESVEREMRKYATGKKVQKFKVNKPMPA